VAKELARQGPYLLDEGLQRLTFRNRWCKIVQRDLASGEPLKIPDQRTTQPLLASFSLENLCSTCVSNVCRNIQKERFSNYEPSLGLLIFVKKLTLYCLKNNVAARCNLHDVLQAVRSSKRGRLRRG